MSTYTIRLSRREDCCIASIPELCITGEAAHPEEALVNVLLAEAEVLEKLRSSGLPFPPPVDRIRPPTEVRELLIQATRFFGKVAAAFAIFLALSVAIAAMIYPMFNERARTYVLSPAAKEDTHKLMKHLGISACIEDKEIKTDQP